MAHVIPLHKHTCERCGDFGCTRPGCPMFNTIDHDAHLRELERRKARGFDGLDGRPL